CLETLAGTVVAYDPRATDNCDPHPTVQCQGLPAGNLFPPGTTHVTCTAFDACQNRQPVVCGFNGTVQSGTICATKFYDRNGDGVFNAGDSFIPGWKMQVTGTDSKGNPIPTMTQLTGSDGRACFAGLPLGTYQVREILPPGTYMATTQTVQ